MSKAGRVLDLLLILSFILVWGLIWLCSSANFAFGRIRSPVYWASAPIREQWGMYANALFVPAAATVSAILCCGLVRFIVGANAYDRALEGQTWRYHPWSDRRITLILIVTVPLSIVLISLFSTNRTVIAQDGVYARVAPWSPPHIYRWKQIGQINIWCYYSKSWKEGLTFDFKDKSSADTAYIVVLSASDLDPNVSDPIRRLAQPIERLKIKVDASGFPKNCSHTDLRFLSELNSGR